MTIFKKTWSLLSRLTYRVSRIQRVFEDTRFVHKDHYILYNYMYISFFLFLYTGRCLNVHTRANTVTFIHRFLHRFVFFFCFSLIYIYIYIYVSYRNKHILLHSIKFSKVLEDIFAMHL